MLQKVEVSLPQLVGRQTVSDQAMEWATATVSLFFGSFKKADADDPETFTAGCLRLFTAYPPDVVAYVVDTVTGLPGKHEWLPALAKVKAALDERASELAGKREREAAATKQLAERLAWEEAKKAAPTPEEIAARTGPNFGLTAPTLEQERERSRRLHLAAVRAGNRFVFQRECEAAGMPSDSPVSPSLLKALKRTTGTPP